MSNDREHMDVARSAQTGKFVSEEEARANPDTTVVEEVQKHPLPVEVTRMFYLWRETDVTEVTVEAGGEPRCVAVGVQFPDGQCSLWWYPPGAVLMTDEAPRTSVAVWPSIEDLQATHLHPRSKTELVWVD